MSRNLPSGRAALRPSRLLFLLMATALTLLSPSPLTAQPEAPPWEEIIPRQNLRPGDTVTLDLSRYLVLPENSIANGELEGLELTFDGPAVTLSVPEDTVLPEGYSFLQLLVGNTSEYVRHITIALHVSKSRLTQFTYADEPGKRVFAAGSFNGWSGTAWPLEYNEETELYEGEFDVPPGSHTYKFVVNGDWIADPANPKMDSSGYGNSVLDGGSGLTPMPPLYFMQTGAKNLRTMPASTIVEGRFIAGDAPLTEIGYPVLTILDGNQQIDPKSFDLATGTLAFKIDNHIDRARRIRIFLTGARANVDGEPTVFRQEFAMVLRGIAGESDWHDAVIYFVMTDRFADGHEESNAPVDDDRVAPLANYHGGDFQGVTQKLAMEGYFEQLGVDTIWLSPVFTGPEGAFMESVEPHDYYTGYHSYWPTHPTEIEPRFGGEEGLRELIAAAHNQGKRILVDFVSNHVHADHPWYQENPEWFGQLDLEDGRKNIRLFDEYPMTTWFDTFLPSFDYPANPEAIEASVEQALYLLDEFGIDGFRHDAVKHVPTSYWARLTERVREQYEVPNAKRVYQVGETISGRGTIMDFVGPTMLDAQFDFPMLWTIRDVFGFRSAGFDDLNQSLLDSLANYGEDHQMVSFVGNHDFSRFVAFADGDVKAEDDEKKIAREQSISVDAPTTYQKLELGLLWVFTVPGMPMFYYGDEFGLSGAGDPDNRRMMKFGDKLSIKEMGMLLRSRQIGRLRRDNPVLWTGSYVPLSVDEETISYLRSSVDGRAVVLMNLGEEVWNAEVALPGHDEAMSFQAVYASNPPSFNEETKEGSFPVYAEFSSEPTTIPVARMSGLVYVAATPDPLKTWDKPAADAATDGAAALDDAEDSDAAPDSEASDTE